MSTAPWIGGSTTYYVDIVKELLNRNVIKQYIFVENRKCKISYSINMNDWDFDDRYSQIIDSIKNDWIKDNIERNDYILSINKDIGQEFLDKIEDEICSDRFVTVKIATFHAQELLNLEIIKTRLLDIMRRYPNMIVQIMVLGKKSSHTAKENASKYKFKSVYRNGIAQMYKEMEECRDRVIVKSVPKWY